MSHINLSIEARQAQETTTATLPKKYVAYYISIKELAHLKRHKTRKSAHLTLEQQKECLYNLISSTGALSEPIPPQIIASFTENLENKKTQKWPELIKAIKISKQHQAPILMAEIATLTAHDVLAQFLLESDACFCCADQPSVDRKTLEALTHYVRLEREKHGQRIRAGLAQTTRSSGNPEATALISRVNKPRIYTAILFAQLLMPLVKTYLKKGFSQRQIVKKLNEEGFSAPEGGKWVLSQLQKVLERAKLNEFAQEHQALIESLQAKNLSVQEITEIFNTRKLASFKRPNWKVSHIEKLIERIKQLKEINKLNNFIEILLPLLHHYQSQGFSEKQILELFEKSDFPLYANPAVSESVTQNKHTSLLKLKKEQLC